MIKMKIIFFIYEPKFLCEKNKEKVKEAIEMCPVGVIEIEK